MSVFRQSCVRSVGGIKALSRTFVCAACLSVALYRHTMCPDNFGALRNERVRLIKGMVISFL